MYKEEIRLDKEVKPLELVIKLDRANIFLLRLIREEKNEMRVKVKGMTN